MGYPIHRKLVIAVASSALFDLADSNAVFEEKGELKRSQSPYNAESGVRSTASPACPCPKCCTGFLRVRYDIAPQPINGR